MRVEAWLRMCRPHNGASVILHDGLILHIAAWTVTGGGLISVAVT